MTRTERATSPRAMLKDRSESKSGLDKSVRKNGAGAHSWGSVRDELDHEREALDDEGIEQEEFEGVPDVPNAAVRPSVEGPADDEAGDVEPGVNSWTTSEDIEKAREFRAKGLKGDIDLSAIARTSSGASANPPKGSVVDSTRRSRSESKSGLGDNGPTPAAETPAGDSAAKKGPSVNGVAADDGVEEAREFRAKGLQSGINLSDIARTSAGASAPKGEVTEVTRDSDTRILA